MTKTELQTLVREELIEYFTEDHRLTEAKKVTQEMWDKDWRITKTYGKEYNDHFAKRIKAAMSVARNEDQAETWALINYKQLPKGALKMVVKESIDEAKKKIKPGTEIHWPTNHKNKSLAGRSGYVAKIKGSNALMNMHDNSNNKAMWIPVPIKDLPKAKESVNGDFPKQYAKAFAKATGNESVNEAKKMTFADYLKILDKKFADAMNAVTGQNGDDAQIKPTRGDILQNFTLFRNYISSLLKKYGSDKTKLKFLSERIEKLYKLEAGYKKSITEAKKVDAKMMVKLMKNPSDWGEMGKQTYIKGGNLVHIDSFWAGSDKALKSLVDSWKPGGHNYDYWKKEYGVGVKVVDQFIEMRAEGRHKKFTKDGVVGVELKITPGTIKESVNEAGLKLDYCDKCMQMTNHKDKKCQKCKKKNESVSEAKDNRSHIILRVEPRNYENMIGKLQDMNINHSRESKNIIKVYTDPTSGWPKNERQSQKLEYKLTHDVWVDKFVIKESINEALYNVGLPKEIEYEKAIGKVVSKLKGIDAYAKMTARGGRPPVTSSSNDIAIKQYGTIDNTSKLKSILKKIDPNLDVSKIRNNFKAGPNARSVHDQEHDIWKYNIPKKIDWHQAKKAGILKTKPVKKMSHDVVIDLLDMMAPYTSKQHELADQVWTSLDSFMQHASDYIKGGNWKKFQASVKKKYPVLESVNEAKTYKDYGLSSKFDFALANLPDKHFNKKSITALAKKLKQDPEKAIEYAKKAFKWLYKESVNELTTSTISGTSGRTITSLNRKKYKLTKTVKGARSGNNINIVLPKGTIIINRPGGVYAIPPNPKIAKAWKDKYVSRSHYAEQARFDEYGLMITSIPETLQAIEDNSKVLESVDEASRSKVFKASKTGSYPATIVVIEKGKVVHQEKVSTPEVVPAAFNVLQKKYPNAILSVEDKTGKILFRESAINEVKNSLIELIREETYNILEVEDPFVPKYGTGDVVHDCPKHVEIEEHGLKGKVVGHTLNEAGEVNYIDIDFGTGKIYENIPTSKVKILQKEFHVHEVKEEPIKKSFTKVQ